jgi:hypothetical protein
MPKITTILVSLMVLLNIVAAGVIYSFISKNIELYINPRAVLPLGSGEVIGYSHTIPQGGVIRIKRMVIDEPAGCPVVIRRYLAPVKNLSSEFLIWEGTRISADRVGKFLLEFETPVPRTFPEGDYRYYSKLEYYCTWVQKVFGPAKFTNQPVLIKIVKDPHPAQDEKGLDIP